MKTAVFFADRHLIHDEPPHWSWDLFKEFLRDFKPDILCDGGDHVDFPYISSFNKDKLLLLEKKRIKKDFDLLNVELDSLRQSCDRMLFLQGNHEQRLDRMIEHQPIFEGDMELENRVDFKGMDIEYYPLKKQPVKIGKHINVMHGIYTGVHHAKKHLLQFMGNVIYFHVHEFQSYYHGIPLRNDEMGANSIGIVSAKDPEWLRVPGHWQNGFGVAYFDDKSFNLYPIIMTKKRFMFNGRLYE